MRGVIAASTSDGLMLRVSERESTKTGTAPYSAKALAVDTKVYDGTITSSPGFKSHKRADISSAWVQEVVSRVRTVPVVERIFSSTRCVNLPLPEVCPPMIASAR